MAHAYVAAGEKDAMLEEARGFAARELGLSGAANPDIIVRSYALFSVEDARALRDIAALAPVGGGEKAVIVSVERMFHEAQNALLKLFEEPPEGTTLILIVPTAGIVLGTLRSRLVPLPLEKSSARAKAAAPIGEAAQAFFDAAPAAREKIVAKLLDRAKSDNDDEKQAARADALRILEALEASAHEKWASGALPPKESHTYALLLRDLDRFIPILHERSAPLKQIFEHILIVLPRGL
jgi:hypothetical protein